MDDDDGMVGVFFLVMGIYMGDKHSFYSLIMNLGAFSLSLSL